MSEPQLRDLPRTYTLPNGRTVDLAPLLSGLTMTKEDIAEYMKTDPRDFRDIEKVLKIIRKYSKNSNAS